MSYHGKEKVSRTSVQGDPEAAAFNFDESPSLMRVSLIKDFARELILLCSCGIVQRGLAGCQTK